MKLVHSLSESNKTISALTVLGRNLYVAYRDTQDNDEEIRLYDTEKFIARGNLLHIDGLARVRDMASCRRHESIYIADDMNDLIHRVHSKGHVTHWPIGDEPSGVSVTITYSLLVTCWRVGKIKEFSPDGECIREIKVQSNAVHPWHAVQLSTDQFVVCHGWHGDLLSRVCVVDGQGSVVQSYGGKKGSGKGQLYVPIRLALHGFVFVADRNNHRVLMLSPTLNFIREVASDLNDPTRMCVDVKTDRLIVCDNKTVKIFKL